MERNGKPGTQPVNFLKQMTVIEKVTVVQLSRFSFSFIIIIASIIHINDAVNCYNKMRQISFVPSVTNSHVSSTST